MRRRDVLALLGGAALSTPLSAPAADEAQSERPSTRATRTAGPLITPHFLIAESQPEEFHDYCCVLNSTGTEVIFERVPVSRPGAYRLMRLSLTGSGDAPRLLFDPPIARVTNRPDWSWAHPGLVAFNYAPIGTGPESLMVGTAESDGSNPTLLGEATAKMIYPTWFPDGSGLAVMNLAGALPKPNTTIIDPSGKNPPRVDIEGSLFWAGMPNVNPIHSNLIAFVGQPIQDTGGYHQDRNSIWIVDTSDPSSAPVALESGALAPPFDRKFQGRAPWWSPDGNWVVFESCRARPPNSSDPHGRYAIFLYRYGSQQPAIQVTDPSCDCNHAKWFPNGFPNYPSGAFQPIVAARRLGSATLPLGPYQLAKLDLTPLGIAF